MLKSCQQELLEKWPKRVIVLEINQMKYAKECFEELAAGRIPCSSKESSTLREVCCQSEARSLRSLIEFEKS